MKKISLSGIPICDLEKLKTSLKTKEARKLVDKEIEYSREYQRGWYKRNKELKRAKNKLRDINKKLAEDEGIIESWDIYKNNNELLAVMFLEELLEQKEAFDLNSVKQILLESIKTTLNLIRKNDQKLWRNELDLDAYKGQTLRLELLEDKEKLEIEISNLECKKILEEMKDND